MGRMNVKKYDCNYETISNNHVDVFCCNCSKSFKKNCCKGEIAHYNQYLNLQQCFQKSSSVDVSKCVCLLKGVG